jgi:cytochrome b561
VSLNSSEGARVLFGKLRHRGRRAMAHGYTSRAFHWLGAAVLAYAFIENGERTRVLTHPDAMRRDVILAIIISTMFLARAIWVYFFRGGSRLPVDEPRWERLATKISFLSIYGLLATSVTTGFLIAYLRPGVVIEQIRRRTRIHDPAFRSLVGFHAGISNFLLFLIYAHIAYAIWHWVVREDGLWESMTGRSLNPVKDSLKMFVIRHVGGPAG